MSLKKGCLAFRRFITNLYKKMFYTKGKVLVLGPSNSGKTSLITEFFCADESQMMNRQTKRIVVDRYEIDKFIFEVYDIPGGPTHYSKWDHYYKKCDLLVYVVDFEMDDDAFLEAKNELQNLLFRNIWLRRPLLVLANKDDIENKISISEVSFKLDLMNLKKVDVACYSISVHKKNNFSHVKEWFLSKIRTKTERV